MKTINTVGDLKRGSFPQFVKILEAVGLRDEMTPEEVRAWWTPERAVEVARLDGRGPRVGAVHSIDCMLGTAVLEGADLRGVDLRVACLDRVYAIGADFRGADLRGASLRGTVLDDADFRRAQLGGVNLESASLAGAEFGGAQLGQTNLALADVECAHFGDARVDLSGARGCPIQAPWAP